MIQQEPSVRESALPDGYWSMQPEREFSQNAESGPEETQLRPAESIGSKNHLTRTTGGIGQCQAMPAAVREVYRELFPKWTEKQMEEDYQKHK